MPLDAVSFGVTENAGMSIFQISPSFQVVKGSFHLRVVLGLLLPVLFLLLVVETARVGFLPLELTIGMVCSLMDLFWYFEKTLADMRTIGFLARAILTQELDDIVVDLEVAGEVAW